MFRGSSSAHHQEFIHCTLSTGICHTGLKTAFEQDQDGYQCPSSGVHSLYTWHWYMSYKSEDSFRAGPGWNCSSILVLLESCLQTCMTYTRAKCTVNELLMMGRGTAPKHVQVNFLAKLNLGNWCICWFYYTINSSVWFCSKTTSRLYRSGHTLTSWGTVTLESQLLWDVTYRRFGTTRWSHLQR